MSPQSPAAEPPSAGTGGGPADTGRPSVLERIGIPRSLFWGFVGVLIFMIGDGVEITYLADYLQQPVAAACRARRRRSRPSRSTGSAS